MREIADEDQISPEYGGTGVRQEDLPSLADALYAAGSRRTPSRGGKEITRPVVTSPYAAVIENRLPRFAVGPGDEEEAKDGDENVESSSRGSTGWFSWWGWGEDSMAHKGNGAVTKQGVIRDRDREASNTTSDEEVRYVTFSAFVRMVRSS